MFVLVVVPQGSVEGTSLGSYMRESEVVEYLRGAYPVPQGVVGIQGVIDYVNSLCGDFVDFMEISDEEMKAALSL